MVIGRVGEPFLDNFFEFFSFWSVLALAPIGLQCAVIPIAVLKPDSVFLKTGHVNENGRS